MVEVAYQSLLCSFLVFLDPATPVAASLRELMIHPALGEDDVRCDRIRLSLPPVQNPRGHTVPSIEDHERRGKLKATGRNVALTSARQRPEDFAVRISHGADIVLILDLGSPLFGQAAIVESKLGNVLGRNLASYAAEGT
jgi:hypothetical protein